MQRVAMELDTAIRRLPSSQATIPGDGQPVSDLPGTDSPRSGAPKFQYDAIVLTASWKWVHLLAVPFLIRTYFELAMLIRRRDVDVILFSSMVTAALAVPLRRSLRKNRVKTAAIVHGQDVTKPVRPYQLFVPKVFAALDMVMPVSSATGEACVKRGLAPEKVAVVHNGVKLDRFARCQWPAGSRSAHPFRSTLAPNVLLLASVGRQVKRKGFAWFIEHVMPKLPDHVHYWLGGDGLNKRTFKLRLKAIRCRIEFGFWDAWGMLN